LRYSFYTTSKDSAVFVPIEEFIDEKNGDLYT